MRPVQKMPANHPAVNDTGCTCGDPLTPGSAIPETSISLFNLETECRETSGADLFYGYNCPYVWSANTGYYAAETVTIYLIVDASGAEYLVLTLDEPESYPGGHFAFDLTSTGLADLDPPVGIITMDDTPEQTRAEANGQLGQYGQWDPSRARGSFYWNWLDCCTDGMILGPLPQTRWTMTFQPTGYNPEMHTFQVHQPQWLDRHAHHNRTCVRGRGRGSQPAFRAMRGSVARAEIAWVQPHIELSSICPCGHTARNMG